MIAGLRVPAATAASTKGRSRSDRTTPRTRRDTRGISAMVIAMMTLPTLPRVSAMRATASRIGGIDIRPSITRMTMPSAQRRNPETRPMASPTSDERSATENPTSSDTRAP